MRRLVTLLPLGILGTAMVCVAAEPARLSPRLTAIIRASAPKFEPAIAAAPAPAPTAASEENPEPAEDPDVIKLPKFYVEANKLAGVEPDKILSKSALAAKQLREYRASLGDLEWALNCFSIPFLTPSVAARAQAKYEDDRRLAEQARLGSVIDVVSQLDPQAAAELRHALTRR